MWNSVSLINVTLAEPAEERGLRKQSAEAAAEIHEIKT